ncbi:MAG: hypothetical protein OEW15_01515 [Nitrospirota bacterium]|nr:hypothetical protein [Nitrospirota bacterium]
MQNILPTARVSIHRVVLLLLVMTIALATECRALTITPASGALSPDATQFLPYTATTTLTAGGVPATPPYTWSATGLPAGLVLSTSGANNEICVITGTPTASGTFAAITITVTDSKAPTARTASGTYTLIINPSCRFAGTNTGSIAFGSAGSIDPSTSPGPIMNTVTTQVNFQCGAGLGYTVAVTNPPGALQMTGANTIPFTLGIASGTSASDSTLIPLLGPSAAPVIPASTISNYENFVVGTSTIGPLTVNISWAGAAPGSLNATVNVAPATVADVCSTPVNGSITFTINPVAAGPLLPNTTLDGSSPTVKCTNGQNHGVSCTSAHGYQLTIGNDGVTDPIAYTITGCPATVTGSGFLTATPINFGLSLNATGAGGYQDAAAGPHVDTITVEVTY